ncbi:MAG TPA: efflux RND transporter permease subunit [Methyloprofundus sp.]|uniref:efflux RND transporter permease subunit n=1 Tax=Methyloprofundus sp. TaxID=2020875 RepID=UPI001831A234|nr:efflux RND transporter permease subunit [Methyloprofundus sp.]HIG65987.1 efflux RND transporter permease subunit [Methyloprofundus sp.]
MLAHLVRFSIRFYGIVIAIAVLILVYGSYRCANAGLDIFPDFAPKQIIIQAESPGYSAEQVEVLVTQRIELALSGLMSLQSTRSESIQGLSIVTAIFAEGSDIYRNRQLVTERLSSIATQLPAGVHTPIPVPLTSSSATVLTIGLSSEHKDLMQLRDLVDKMIVPRILSVHGVADVNIFGGDIRQLQIQLDPLKLQQHNISINEVITAVSQNGNLQGSGFIENSNQRFTLQVTGLATTPEQLRQSIIQYRDNTTLLLSDIAHIQYAAEPPIGAAQVMGKPGIVMMVIGQFNANTLTVSNAVESTLSEFEPLFAEQHIDFYAHLFKPADYIKTSVHNLSSHLLLGGLFVVIILYLFLYNLRTAFISAIAIPLSLISAILVLLELKINLNIMVLGGLAIALGEVVDDAIIDTENIFRRLRENRLLANPEPSHQIVYQASMEVRSSVVYASFIVALVFVPLLTLEGVAGRLFAPLGYSYILAILMSLLVALSLTPALCYVLLSKDIQLTGTPPVIAYLNPLYTRLLKAISAHFKLIIIACLVFSLLAVMRFATLGHKFLPELREGHYIVHTTSIPGTSLQESIRQGIQVSAQFRQIEEIESVSQWAGRAERGADTYGSHYSEYEVRLKPLSGTEQQKVLQQLRGILSSFPGLLFEANTFLIERVDETISGYTSPVVVNIYGSDLNLLDKKAQQVAALMQTIPGATDIQLRSPPGTPLIQIQLNQEKLKFWGVPAAEVLQTIQAAYAGQIVGKQLQGNSSYNISVTLRPDLRQLPLSIEQLPVRTLAGKLINLGELVDIKHHAGRYNILHQNAQRRQSVTCNVVNRDMAAFMQELKTRVTESINFTDNIYPEFTGAAVEQTQAKQKLILHALLASIGVLIFIYIAIQNLRHVAITLLNIPFSLIGGMIAVIIMDATLSIGSIIGFITLFGITVRNSIMLLSHYQYLVEQEAMPWNLATALKGAQERLPSILMTALVTALAMAPIAFNSDNPGLEIMGPMAAIIIGGLVSSTLLNLLLLPLMLLKYGKFKTAH